MPHVTPERIHIDVGDTKLGALRWRGRAGAPLAIAIHGITANAWCWAAVARHLDGQIGFVAIDLRGRGASCAAPGPFGIRRHANDLAAVIRGLSGAPAILAGHSMGTYVALDCAEQAPDLVDRIVLVDGGPPVGVPARLTPGEALDELLGPSIARLRRVWPDRVSYHQMWAQHPAFAGGLTPEIERYVLSDLEQCDGGFRSNVSEEAVTFDGTEMFTDPSVRTLIDRVTMRLSMIRAEAGILAGPPPFVASSSAEQYPQHDWQTIDGTNHYSILIGEAGAEATARALLVNSQL